VSFENELVPLNGRIPNEMRHINLRFTYLLTYSWWK